MGHTLGDVDWHNQGASTDADPSEYTAAVHHSYEAVRKGLDESPEQEHDTRHNKIPSAAKRFRYSEAKDGTEEGTGLEGRGDVGRKEVRRRRGETE